jgi:uncharacterized protein (DUF433 family)
MDSASLPPLIGTGLYPLTEAARIAQLDTRTARRWAEGYAFISSGEHRVSAGVMPLALAKIGKNRDVTFAELLTLRLVRGFRAAGLGLRTIKRVADRAAADFDLSMPFVSKQFRTDGRNVFIELRTEVPANDEPAIPRQERELIEVLTGQRAFADVVEPFLFANVDWHDDIASRWWPLGMNRSVILDPHIVFGAPHVMDTSVPTAALASALRAEGGGATAIEAVANWYGVPLQAVEDAVHFETEWLQRAA